MANTIKITERTLKVLMALEGLGDSPDQVAQILRRQRIKGVRNTVRFLNPVIRYVQQELAENLNLDLIQGDRLRINLPNNKKEEVEVPASILEFLSLFNGGRKYQDLVMVEQG